MDIQMLTEFFKWCSIINIGLLIFSFFMIVTLKDFVYKTHSKWFPMSRERFNFAIYVIFGIYKILVFAFNLVPYIALSIMQ